MPTETRLPLSCPRFISGEECPASSGEQFDRDHPTDDRVVVTTAEEGTHADMWAAIDAARDTLDSNASAWLDNYKLRELGLYQTSELIRANDVPYGLVAEVWTKDCVRSVRVARRIRAATVWISDSYAQLMEGIWGGFKQSGIGS